MRELRRLNAWIDDAAIKDIDGDIHVVNIFDNAPQIEMEYGGITGKNGQYLLGRSNKSRKIGIEFDIRELYNLSRRAAIVDAVNAWAKDGILKVSYRPEQRIRVIRATPAHFDAAKDVTNSYTVEFEACAVPYWECDIPSTLQLSGTIGTDTLYVPGSAPAAPEIEVKATGGTLNALTLAYAGRAMAFQNLNIAVNKSLIISHDDRGWLKITSDGVSKLPLRTAASVDDFTALPGEIEVAFAADVACTVDITARGCYI